MDFIIPSLSACVLAATLLTTSSFADQPGLGASNEAKSVQKKVAFHVMGLMKTKSGAT